jgi:hypothetical protein
MSIQLEASVAVLHPRDIKRGGLKNRGKSLQLPGIEPQPSIPQSTTVLAELFRLAANVRCQLISLRLINKGKNDFLFIPNCRTFYVHGQTEVTGYE